MSERERWVVYPLLFLALGAALRDKLFDRTITKSIVCQELTVLEEEPSGVRILAQIGRSDSMRARSNAYMVVNGQLDTDLINANQYAFRNVPFVPALQTIMSPTMDLLRSLQQSIKRRQPDASTQRSTSPQSGSNQAESSAETAPAGKNQSAPTDVPSNSSDAPAASPLADPAESR